MIGLITAMVTALFAVAITFIMKEGEAIQNLIQKKIELQRPCKMPLECDLAFPESSTIVNRMLAAVEQELLGLWFLCFLIQLGDGFEGMFMFYMRDVLGFDAGEAILWANIFIFATYLGLLGPWLSDYYGRAKVLRWSAMGLWPVI